MARKRKGVPVTGWLAIDKPVGPSSAAIVAKVLRETGAAKAGHGGTLDPLASGILPIALGDATKTVQYVMDGSKTYRWTVRWGENRTTLDAEGAVTEQSIIRPTALQIQAALAAFQGEITQIPPIYSALKIDGERAYDLARQGAEVEMTPRRVMIYSYRLVDQPDADHAQFEARVGKGTYVRALARDMAQSVGACGYVSQLRRIACGPFDESNAICLETLTGLGHGPALRGFMLPVETVLDDIPALALTPSEAHRLRAGQFIALNTLELAAFPEQSLLQQVSEGGVVRAMEAGQLVALAQIEGGLIRPKRVFSVNTIDV